MFYGGRCMKKVSVIIPVYNVAPYLRKCLDSVIGQTYENLEIILINDGTKDASLSICEEYKNKDSRIRLYSQKNQGLSAARNLGIDHATGEYITFVDSDDWLELEFVETLVTELERTDSDIAVGNFNKFEMEKSLFHIYALEKDYYVKTYTPNEWYDNIFSVANLSLCFVTAWGKVYKRNLFDGLHYPVGKVSEDDYTTYLTYMQAKQIVYVHKPLYVYRYNNEGISHTSPRTDLSSLQSFEEEMTMMMFLGLDMTKIKAYYLHRLRINLASTLQEGRYEEYLRVKKKIDILKMHGIEV